MPTWNEVVDEIKEVQETRPTSFDEVRRKYLEQLADHTNREVILYSSGWTEMDITPPQLSLTDTDVHGFMQTIHDFESDELDLIIHSPGGSPEVAEQIVTYLREKFEYIRIIIPQAALSAATLLCCAADEVVMAHHSALGPTDPQLLIPTETGRQWVAAQSIIDEFEQIDERVQNGDDIYHYTPMLTQFHPGLLKEAREAVQLSQQLAGEWAAEYMFGADSDSKQKANELSEFLSDRSNFMSHNRRISRRRIDEHTDMKVTELEEDQELQDSVLSIFHATTATHSHANAVKIIENHHGSLYSRKVSRQA